MNIQELQVDRIRGLIIRFDDSMVFTRKLLRFSEFTTKKDFRRVFLIEEYAQVQGIPPEHINETAAAIMVLGSYIEDMYSFYGRERLYPEEEALVDYLIENGYLSSSVKVQRPFFVIGINPRYTNQEKGLIEHELSHVRYRTEESYRQIVAAAWDTMREDEQSVVRHFLVKKLGYREEELLNEFQAHLFDGFDDIMMVCIRGHELLEQITERTESVAK